MGVAIKFQNDTDTSCRKVSAIEFSYPETHPIPALSDSVRRMKITSEGRSSCRSIEAFHQSLQPTRIHISCIVNTKSLGVLFRTSIKKPFSEADLNPSAKVTTSQTRHDVTPFMQALLSCFSLHVPTLFRCTDLSERSRTAHSLSLVRPNRCTSNPG